MRAQPSREIICTIISICRKKTRTSSYLSAHYGTRTNMSRGSVLSKYRNNTINHECLFQYFICCDAIIINKANCVRAWLNLSLSIYQDFMAYCCACFISHSHVRTDDWKGFILWWQTPTRPNTNCFPLLTLTSRLIRIDLLWFSLPTEGGSNQLWHLWDAEQDADHPQSETTCSSE